ncbi:MAG TPA: 50S ribosomal protein L33 [Dehalococcoidia bacterium]|jgi:large subunit ribosomal protein L33|nr:50S ribosomal protein L33 [Dehalococcoidia bacterium]
MAKSGVRDVVTMQCTECGERNYTSEKNKRNDTQRIELKKFCSRCRTHVVHRETR